MTKTDDMDYSFRLNVKSIDEIMTHRDSFMAERLLQCYESNHNKTAFVTALIGRLLAAELRK